MTLKFTIGADPEVFVRDVSTMQFISAHGMVKGTKQKPQKMGKGAIQVDGVALEFNIHPATSKETFVGNIMSMKNVLKQEIQKKNKDYHLCITPTAVFPKDYFEQLPEKAKELGCEPDYNAWTGEVNPKPSTSQPLRTASGHIHIGWLEKADYMEPMEPNHFDLCRCVARQLDVALLLPSLLFDGDQTRRALYGNPGAFRPKPYGMEYRCLSNAWIADPKLIMWVYENTQRALKDLYMDKKYYEVVDDFETQWESHTRDTFHTSDPNRHALRNYLNRYPNIFQAA